MKTILLNVTVVLLTLVFVLLCVILPYRIHLSNDDDILAAVYISENSVAGVAYDYAMTLEQRLKLVSDSRKSNSSVVANHVEIVDMAQMMEGLEQLAPEIEVMKSENVFPSYVCPDFSGNANYMGVITCVDLQNPAGSSVYHEITATCPETGLQCYFRQDVESGKVIEYWIRGGIEGGSPEFESWYGDMESVARGWTNYLDLDVQSYGKWEEDAGRYNYELSSTITMRSYFDEGAFVFSGTDVEYDESSEYYDGQVYYDFSIMID